MAHVPIHSIELRVENFEGLVVGERPAYQGGLTGALRFPVTVRIPGPDQPTVVAVVDVVCPTKLTSTVPPNPAFAEPSMR